MFLWALPACHPTTDTSDSPGDPASGTNATHLPVEDFIKADIKKVETEAGGILMKTIRGAKKDSVYINLDSFKKEAAAFLPEELDSARFQENFTETSLMDETSGLLHFIYTPKLADQGLKKIVVYVSPSLGMDKVNRLYFEREVLQNAILIRQKLTWKIGHYFIIAESRSHSEATPQVMVKKVIWDPAYFEED